MENEVKYIDVVTLKIVRDKTIPYANKKIGGPESAYEIVKSIIGDMDREAFVVVCLDVKNQPTNVQITSIGTTSSSIVDMKETFKAAIISNASGIICFHNHPSGIVKPSQNDKACTQRLMKASDLLGMRFLDHIIISDDKYYSFKENGEI